MQRTAPPALRGVGLRPADTLVGALVTGSERSRPVTTGESVMWADTPKRMGIETLSARNGQDSDGVLRGSAVDRIPSSFRAPPELFGRSVHRNGCTTLFLTGNPPDR